MLGADLLEKDSVTSWSADKSVIVVLVRREAARCWSAEELLAEEKVSYSVHHLGRWSAEDIFG